MITGPADRRLVFRANTHSRQLPCKTGISALLRLRYASCWRGYVAGVSGRLCLLAMRIDPSFLNVSVGVPIGGRMGALSFSRRTPDPPERGDMNSAPTDAQRPHVVQAAAERRSTSAFDRKARTSHPSTPRSRSVHVPQGKSISSLTAAAPATADDQQAEYFVRLLTQRRQRIEQRIDDHQRAIAVAESRGKTEDVRRYRQMTLIEEHDRRTVADLIDNLQRRFPGRAPAEVPRVARRVRPLL